MEKVDQAKREADEESVSSVGGLCFSFQLSVLMLGNRQRSTGFLLSDVCCNNGNIG